MKGFEKIFKRRDLRNVLYIFKVSIKSFYKLLKASKVNQASKRIEKSFISFKKKKTKQTSKQVLTFKSKQVQKVLETFKVSKQSF